ncbi:uncharacterized protein LOC124355642 [Homalodisca vitripennis]|uniref:uncharacterized protein LOC124355642 n=1 Tax=Homalodisca vitripennis TaxID=197043 RepID=UPI001EEB0427|nr:uncharacterized protein LOC124355642 [Homalodisca vitripennis]
MVLKHCSALLAPQLTVLFNKLLEQGIFPDSLKSSYVVPIHKSSTLTNVRNYRPIVIQPALGKIFESLVLDRISFAFRSILIHEQHGFTPVGLQSPISFCIKTTFYILFKTTVSQDSVYIDFSKAFDTNNLKLNIAKCAVITFHRSSAPILFDYILNNSALIRKTSIRDLGIVISHSLGPESHIDAITTKASRNLGISDQNFKKRTECCSYEVYLYCSGEVSA